VVVITDGQLPDLFDIALAKTTAQRMASEGITVSVIQVLNPGDVSSAVDMKQIADFGKGVLHRSEDPGAIASLVFAEVKRVLGSVGRRPSSEIGMSAVPQRSDPPPTEPEPPTVLEPEPPTVSEPTLGEVQTSLRVFAVANSPLLTPEPTGNYPPVHGILPVTGRPDARVLLAAGDQGIPLLAFANRGLGRVGVWTSDLSASWGRDWLADPALPGRLATWLSHLRPAQAGDSPELLLDQSQLSPEAPTRAEREWIEALAAAPMNLLEDYRPPGECLHLVDRGRAAELAMWAALTILFLALVEFSLRRSEGA